MNSTVPKVTNKKCDHCELTQQYKRMEHQAGQLCTGLKKNATQPDVKPYIEKELKQDGRSHQVKQQKRARGLAVWS